MFFERICVVMVLVLATSGTFAKKTCKKNACKKSYQYFFPDLYTDCYHNPDVYANTPEILSRYTSNYENHTVTTEDGYILSIFRIPPKGKSKGVILLQHPVTTDSIIWVGQSNESLAFLMSTAGYDVWLPNQRGTFFSNKHANLSSQSAQYWDFSFHEIGFYDYSASIKYIKDKTNSSLVFVGHSMSTAASIIYASLKPQEAKNSVKVFIELSPTVYMKDIRSPLKFLAALEPFFKQLFGYLRIYSLLEYNSLSSIPYKISERTHFKVVIIILICAVVGWTPKEYDYKLFNLMTSQNPRGVSWKTLYHYAQFINSEGRFQMYDYGEKQNLMLYKSPKPTEYPVSKIQAPIYLVSSKDDYTATTDNINQLYETLPEEAKIYGKHTVRGLNHIDFHYGKHRKELIFDNIFELLKKIL